MHFFFFFSSRRRHTRSTRDWSSDVCSSDLGGIWRSDDAGVSWRPVDDFMANLAVSSLVINPRDPNVMYAGTGEIYSNYDALHGGGIFKSTDGGVTWALLPATAPASNSAFFN